MSIMHIDSFISYLKTEKRYSSYTLKAYESDLLQFLSFMDQGSSQASGENDHKGENEHKLVRSWIISMMEAGMSPRSVRRKVSALGTWYNYLLRNELIIVNPLHKVTVPKSGKPLPGFITETKMDQLLDDVDFGNTFTGIRDRLIIEILYFTGMRRSELVSLCNSDVDCSEMLIRVSGKGGKQRIIPVGQEFANTLNDYTLKKEAEFGTAQALEPFFVTAGKKRLYPELVYRVVKKYLYLVSPGPGRSPHIIRHSFATHMLNHGADLNAIKDLLGHASLAATQVYTHNTFEKIKKIYKQAHPRA